MKFYLISDNMDTLTGMRLAGIEGEVAHTAPSCARPWTGYPPIRRWGWCC